MRSHWGIKLAWIQMTALMTLSASTFAEAETSSVEAFQLRTMCQSLGEKLASDEAQVGSYWSQEVTTNFSLKSLHCYVMISDSTADVTTSANNFKTDVYLYDAQTKELLANYGAVGQDLKSGRIFDEHFKGPSLGFNQAKEYILRLMDPER